MTQLDQFIPNSFHFYKEYYARKNEPSESNRRTKKNWRQYNSATIQYQSRRSIQFREIIAQTKLIGLDRNHFFSVIFLFLSFFLLSIYYFFWFCFRFLSSFTSLLSSFAAVLFSVAALFAPLLFVWKVFSWNGSDFYLCFGICLSRECWYTQTNGDRTKRENKKDR